MKCPYCGFAEDKVIDSRPTDDGCAIRRRRECEACNKRFTTYEKIEMIPLVVVKKDGSRQTFERSKILKSILRACEKRNVSSGDLERLTNEIETEIYNSMRREVSSVEIGELILEKLKTFDEVAYVRFASVYRQFKNVDSFMEELRMLKHKKNNN